MADRDFAMRFNKLMFKKPKKQFLVTLSMSIDNEAIEADEDIDIDVSDLAYEGVSLTLLVNESELSTLQKILSQNDIVYTVCPYANESKNSASDKDV